MYITYVGVFLNTEREKNLLAMIVCLPTVVVFKERVLRGIEGISQRVCFLSCFKESALSCVCISVNIL